MYQLKLTVTNDNVFVEACDPRQTVIGKWDYRGQDPIIEVSGWPGLSGNTNTFQVKELHRIAWLMDELSHAAKVKGIEQVVEWLRCFDVPYAAAWEIV